VLEAPKGTETYRIAVEIAAAIACTEKKHTDAPLPCGRCDSCVKILSDNCIDVITVEKEDKATIGVQKIRDLMPNVILAPSELEAKVYIINEADRMTEEAQNSLLKILEEPPVAETYFILCAENSEALIPTIISRAPVIRLNAPDRNAVCEILVRETGVGRKEALEAAAMAENSVCFAKEVINESAEGKRKKELYERARTMTEMLAEKKSKAELILLVSSFPQKKDDVTEILRLIYAGVRDIIAVKRYKEASTDLYPTAEDARVPAKRMTVRSAIAVSDAVSEALAALEKNASPKNVMLSFALSAHNAVFG
jgi:DNA polymerase-3 subunit delta'